MTRSRILNSYLYELVQRHLKSFVLEQNFWKKVWKKHGNWQICPALPFLKVWAKLTLQLSNQLCISKKKYIFFFRKISWDGVKMQKFSNSQQLHFTGSLVGKGEMKIILTDFPTSHLLSPRKASRSFSNSGALLVRMSLNACCWGKNKAHACQWVRTAAGKIDFLGVSCERDGQRKLEKVTVESFGLAQILKYSLFLIPCCSLEEGIC